jgi:hypothetical protein
VIPDIGLLCKDRQGEPKSRAPARPIGGVNAAAVGFDDGAADRKPNAHAVPFGREETLE